jgi:3-oxoacyl-[acyl-carrier protein] reductase
MFQLSGKTALITGASGGIGSAIARNLSQQGAHVVLHGTRAGRLEELASEIGSNVSVVTANLSDRDAVGGLGCRGCKSDWRNRYSGE